MARCPPGGCPVKPASPASKTPHSRAGGQRRSGVRKETSMAKANDHVQPPLSSSADDVLDTLTRSEADLQDRLEHLREFVNTGTQLLHHRIWLDLDEFEERFDQIIAILPKEVRRARKIVREEQRIIQDAKDEARR